ncbi:group I truncated hemoglobin [Pseudoalteromonas phenolica]|uniref:group I truncated hemoglobin n=1 Tax=Pseudoalteromonas phenolica TaxID=161398 RepID=UPI00110A805C|nr:group 1 truncated hemoglobin [Pseudoalteromonas phenolica]TMO53903.1 group 1 truncated hemoglobin [Pseudoalteromonas phenolica]
MRRVLFIIGALLIVSLSGCSSKPKLSLYQQLGAEQGIERIVDAFIKRIAKDKAILPYFAKSSVSHFRAGFIAHMCDISDGPCKYTGDSMIDIHTGMNINEADFNRVVELLILAMEDAGISYRKQNQVLAKLAPLRGEVFKR